METMKIAGNLNELLIGTVLNEWTYKFGSGAYRYYDYYRMDDSGSDVDGRRTTLQRGKEMAQDVLKRFTRRN